MVANGGLVSHLMNNQQVARIKNGKQKVSSFNRSKFPKSNMTCINDHQKKNQRKIIRNGGERWF
jgi:hypothetical protein